MSDGSRELHVVFKVADNDFVIAASDVAQMESFLGSTVVPGAPDYVAGIVQVRGKIVPVVDLRRRFGHPDRALTLDSRIVVGRDGDRPVALLVDSAREVVWLTPAQLEAPPKLVTEETKGFVRAVARMGDRLLMLIDFKKVIGEEPLHGH